jgi:SAM-dependent methyltransferase
MAHSQQLKFIELVNKHFVQQQRKVTDHFKILEIGSFDINGSIRAFLQDSKTEYIGVDLCEGKGVDIISFGHTLELPENSIDFVISCECFEHDPHWLETFKNMYKFAKCGAFVAFTCASLGRLEHGTRRTNPDHSPGTQFIGLDYYKNLTKEDFYKKLDIDKLFVWHYFFYEKSSHDLYFVGRKVGGDAVIVDEPLFLEDVSHIKRLSKLRLKLIEVPVNIARLVFPEQAFQNFSISYLNKVRPFRSWCKSLMR